MSKREAEDVQNSQSPSKIPRTNGNESSFERMNTEAEWTPTNAERTYILRFIHGETCCEPPYADVDDWPTISFTHLVVL
jgi:hypothetical protein